MKDMTSVATTMMSDEEKAEIEKQLNGEGHSHPTTPPVAGAAHADVLPAAAKAAEASVPHSPITESAPSATYPPAPAGPAAAARPDAPQHHSSSLVPHGEKDASPSSPSPSTQEKEKERQREVARKRNKISQEQKEKLREQERERRKVMEARVTMLTTKMIERLRPFVEAKHPGEKDDPETAAFEKKMKREADDLKLESFGVEVSVCLGFMASFVIDLRLRFPGKVATHDWERIHDESIFFHEIAQVPRNVRYPPYQTSFTF